MNIIQWCNENNGFLTAILSLIGLVLSVPAIVVSLRTARLPYKKKLMLGSYMSFDTRRLLRDIRRHRLCACQCQQLT